MRSKGSILAVGSGITALGMGLLTPVLPAYAASLGASAALIGLFLASFGFTRLLVGLPTGWLARRLGYRALLVGSPALIVPASLFCAVAGNFWSLALFCTAEGAAAAVYGTVSTAALAGENRGAGRSLALYLAAFTSDDERPIGISLYRTFGDVGATLAPLLTGWLVDWIGYRISLVVLLSVLLVAVTLFAWGAPKVKVAYGTGTPAQETTRSVTM